MKTCFILVRDDVFGLYPLIEASLKILGGDFLDLSISNDGLPDNIESAIPEDKLAAISEFSKQLHIADTAKDGAFFHFERIDHKRLGVKLVIDNGEPGRILQSQSSDRASILATILISPATSIFEGHNVVGFLYNPDSMDPTNKEKLNEYFCKVMEQTFPDARLVVFVRTRNVDEALYRPPVSLVGALEADCFIPLLPASEVLNNIRQCGNRIKKETPVIFFLGAGYSSESNIPMGPELCRKALEQLLIMAPEDSYEDLEQQFWNWVATRNRWLPGEREVWEKREKPQLTFERVVREQIGQHGHADAPVIKYLSEISRKSLPSSGHLAIAEIIRKGYKILIMTTNYDTLIEQVLESYGLKYLSIFNEKTASKNHGPLKSYLRGESDTIPVVKLHGTIKLPVTISASVEDTTSLKPAIRDLLGLVLKEGMHRSIGIPERIPVVFGGYAFRDADVRKVLDEKDTLEGIDPWVVDPLPRDLVNNFLSLEGRKDIIATSRILSTRFGLFMGELDQYLV